MIILIFILATSNSKKISQVVKNLHQLFYICYFLLFQKNIGKIEIIALINFRSKVNAINSINTAKIDF